MARFPKEYRRLIKVAVDQGWTTPTATMMETYAGGYLDLGSPDAESINLGDVARGLAGEHRYRNQCSEPLTVAEHALRVSARCLSQAANLTNGYGETSAQMAALVGLHHDDTEGYLGDCHRPLKRLLEERAPGVLDEITCDVAAAISHALNVPSYEFVTCALARRGHPVPWWYDVVREADEWVGALEARLFMPSRGEGWSTPWDMVSGGADPDDEMAQNSRITLARFGLEVFDDMSEGNAYRRARAFAAADAELRRVLDLEGER